MPAVLIYSQDNLEYIVLPNRRILSKAKDLVRPIANADRHAYWTDVENRKRIQEDGKRFFEQHQDYLGTPPSMEDVDGKMSPGFFLYLTFLRFQTQVYQASIVRNSDINKLTKEKSEFNDNLAKLLTLQTAMEHLVKAREYVDRREDAPEGADVQTGSRGGLWYDPDKVKQQGDMPTGVQELDVVQPAAVPIKKPTPQQEDDKDVEGDEGDEGFVTDEAFMKAMQAQGFVAVNPDDAVPDYLDNLDKTVTFAEKTKMIEDEAIRLRVPATEAVPIEPNIKILDKEGNLYQITTTDGQIVAINKIDTSDENIKRDEKTGDPILTPEGYPTYINPRGKLHLHVNPNAPNPNTDDPNDNYIQYTYHDGLRNKKSGYSLRYNAGQDIAKFDKIAKLVPKIPSIKKAVKADFADPTKAKAKFNMSTRSVTEASLALALILDTARRIGGPSGESTVTADGKEGRPKKLDKETKKPLRVKVPTYGVTTIQARHIIVDGKNVSLQFIGKSGKTNYVNITDEMVKKEFIKRKKTLQKNDTVIRTSGATVTKYLKAVAGADFSPKNFRTYQGTVSAVEILDNIDVPSHFGDFPITLYKTKDKVPIEVPSTWGAEFNKYMTAQMKEGGITNGDEYQRLGLLWLLKSQHISKRDFVGRPVSEKLSNTPDMSLTKYINPVVFDEAGWNDAFRLEQEEFLQQGAPSDLAAQIKKAQAPRPTKKAKGKPKPKAKRKKA